jgi:nucleotide-binding universal stress UspA family protein
MRVLICSDGRPAADNAVRIGGLLAAACRAETSLLGIAEQPADENALRQALEAETQTLRGQGLTPKVTLRAGEPIRQILSETSATHYDLVVIGARRTGTSGLLRLSEKTYEVVKSISPPVLVAVGERTQLKRFLVCSGGKAFIEAAVKFTGQLAAAAGASVTLLHVMAEPPAIYADLVQLEEDLDRLLESKSELGLNLRRQREQLKRIGVPTEVRIRHGMVVDQVFQEVQLGTYDLIVTGSSRARGIMRHYIMGDLTRSILDRSDIPVLVARAGEQRIAGLWESLKQSFTAARG